jgi:ribonucleoside-diphosphate reductase alpha chain
VLHPKFAQWIDFQYDGDYTNYGVEKMPVGFLDQAFEQSPWYQSTANDIDWIKRVKIQSVIQKYISHSISSTINLPESVKEEEVSEIYLESYKQGLKGITVYRDGSRSGVLVSNDKKDNNSFEYKDAIKRPKQLDGQAYTSKSGTDNYNIFVGTLNNKPYEVFINTNTTIKGEGVISKTAKGKYIFIEKASSESLEINSNITDEQAAITRLISTSLRHGADIKFIVEQLSKIDGDLFSFTKVLARILKKYIPEGAKSTAICKDCGSDQIVFEEGCMSCKSCGSSKCS